jgi:hypothetical protein
MPSFSPQRSHQRNLPLHPIAYTFDDMLLPGIDLDHDQGELPDLGLPQHHVPSQGKWVGVTTATAGNGPTRHSTRKRRARR